MTELATPQDLGLSYEEAAHGIQSAIKFEIEQIMHEVDRNQTRLGEFLADRFKHHRVGIDLSKSDAQGLASLLIKKGVFTLDEYLEHMRLYANAELVRYTEHCRREYGLPPNVEFR